MPVIAASAVFQAPIVTEDFVNSRVGINTTTPATALHVRGSVFGDVNAGASASVAGIVSGTGSGSGGAFYNTGSGNGSALLVSKSGTGTQGSAISASISGPSTSHVILATSNTATAGSCVFAENQGASNSNSIQAQIGTVAASSGTGSAGSFILFAAGGAAHDSALQATSGVVGSPAIRANGNIVATGTVTSSDRRIKSDFQPVTPELMATIGRLPIQTYYKHLDGRVSDAAMGPLIDELRRRVAEIDTLKATPELTAERAVAVARIDAFDNEDWLAVQGPRIPGRLAGVIAQEVEAVAPDYVIKSGAPFKNGPDLESIRQINDPSILYIMIETLRHDMAKLSAEFAAYRATHP